MRYVSTRQLAHWTKLEDCVVNSTLNATMTLKCVMGRTCLGKKLENTVTITTRDTHQRASVRIGGTYEKKSVTDLLVVNYFV